METLKLTRPNKDLAGIHWAIMALAKNDNRFHVSRLRITDIHDHSMVMAVDGSRMHVYETNTHYEPGYYEVFCHLKTRVYLHKDCLIQDGNYPDITKQVELFSLRDPFWTTLLNVGDVHDVSISFCKIVHHMTIGTSINYEYLQDAISGKGKCVASMFENREGMLLIESGQRKAIIMQMKA
jgi:hypothetical protein